MSDDARERARRAASPDNGQRAPPTRQERKQTVQEMVTRHAGAVESCGHDELFAMDLPPPSWVVEGLVVDEGFTLLGGKKKLGKSWLCLQIAQAVALGTLCLGRPTVQGGIVFLCLEDGRRRLKARLEKQHAPKGLPITYYTRFPPLDGDGIGMLMEVLEEKKPRLCIIDTLAAAKTGKVDENAAGAMADIGNALHVIGQMFKAGIFATHHHGKLIGGDPGDDLRGSSALAAAADVNLGLYREQSGHVLRGEGKDIDLLSLGINFDAVDTWCWQAREDQRDVARDDADRAAIEAVRGLGEADAEAVAEMIGRSRRTAADRLRRLASDGVLAVRFSATTDDGGRPRILFSVRTSDDGEMKPF
jgi:hypothetical protein